MDVQQHFSGIFDIHDSVSFNAKAAQIFSWQRENNPVYAKFVEILNRPDIERPLLPVQLFKKQPVYSGDREPEAIFTSSSTTGSEPSKHYVYSLDMYRQSYTRSFRLFYGDPSRYCILALLPSYLEREGSSLIEMCKGLMESSGHPLNGFFLHDTNELVARIRACAERGEKVWLVGVSYALLDLAQACHESWRHVTVVETGGMKGRRKEIIREELHGVLRSAWGLDRVHSEYGMTEMLSQCYARRGGFFEAPPWVRVSAHPVDDMLATCKPGQTGVLGITDLANVASCSFLLTGDLGRVYEDGSFEVLGRMDNAEIRGCNLMLD